MLYWKSAVIAKTVLVYLVLRDFGRGRYFLRLAELKIQLISNGIFLEPRVTKPLLPRISSDSHSMQESLKNRPKSVIPNLSTQNAVANNNHEKVQGPMDPTTSANFITQESSSVYNREEISNKAPSNEETVTNKLASEFWKMIAKQRQDNYQISQALMSLQEQMTAMNATIAKIQTGRDDVQPNLETQIEPSDLEAPDSTEDFQLLTGRVSKTEERSNEVNGLRLEIEAIKARIARLEEINAPKFTQLPPRDSNQISRSAPQEGKSSPLSTCSSPLSEADCSAQSSQISRSVTPGGNQDKSRPTKKSISSSMDLSMYETESVSKSGSDVSTKNADESIDLLGQQKHQEEHQNQSNDIGSPQLSQQEEEEQIVLEHTETEDKDNRDIALEELGPGEIQDIGKV